MANSNTSQVRQLSDGNPDGTLIGRSTSDPIGFYGNPPVPQRTNPRQALLAPLPGGQIITWSANCGTITATGANGCANTTITNTGLAVAATDFVVAISSSNGTTGWSASQANLAVSPSIIPTTDTVDVMFAGCNATVTPTPNIPVTFTALRGFPVVSANVGTTWANANVARTSYEQVINIAGANAGGNAVLNANGGVDYISVSNQGNGQYWLPPDVTILPDTANGFVSGYGATAKCTVSNGYVNSIIVTAKGNSYSNYANGAAAVKVILTGGPNVSPGMLVGVQKPTHQTNFFVAGARVLGNNQIGVTYAVMSAANVTPTANEVWKFCAFGQIPPTVPIIRVQANLANFGSVTANQTNKMDVTVTGLVPTDTLLAVNPQVATANSMLLQSWVSAANTAEIIYASSGNLTVAPANGIFQIDVLQSNQAVPCATYSIPVGALSLNANTGQELIVALPANMTIQANTTIVVNPTQAMPANVVCSSCGRANSTTTVGITFMNLNTANSVTIPAQNYMIGAFSTPIVSIAANQIAGATFVSTLPTTVQKTELINELQSALNVTGFIQGS
jgi:hypothetical protein